MYWKSSYDFWICLILRREWPKHYVAHTHGAAIYEPIIQTLRDLKINYKVLTKGTDSKEEEYSVFSNYNSREWLYRFIYGEYIGQIDICGIAGDICVYNTLLNGIIRYGESKFNLLIDFCPSLDGGKKLNDFNIKKTYGKD